MTTIKVIDTAVVATAAMSAEELTTTFEQMAEAVAAIKEMRDADIPRHFANFLRLKLDEQREAHLLSRPEISELLIRDIVELARVIRARECGEDWSRPLTTNNYYALPVLAVGALKRGGDGAAADKYDSSNDSSNTYNDGAIIYIDGGAAAAAATKKPKTEFRRRFVMQAQRRESRHIIEGALQIRFDSRVLALISVSKTTNRKRQVAVAENSETNIIGLQLSLPGSNDELNPPQTDPRFGPTGILIPKLKHTNIADIIKLPAADSTSAALEATTAHAIIINTDIAALTQTFDLFATIYSLPNTRAYALSIGANGKGPFAWMTIPAALPFLPEDAEGIIEERITTGSAKDAANIAAILRRLETLHNIAFSTWYDTSAPSDLDATNLYHIFVTAFITGIDSDKTKALIDRRLALRALIQLGHRVKHKMLLAKNEVNEYLLIISRKLPSIMPRLERAMKLQPGLSTDSAALLDLLKPAERKTVTLEYEAAQAFAKAMLENKCPHVAIVRELRQTTATRVLNAKLSQLNSYMERPADRMVAAAATAKNINSMIACTNCHLPMICPHVLIAIITDQQTTDYRELKAALTPFINPQGIQGQFFCRICGEYITTSASIESVDGMGASPQNDELRKMIWGEIIQLLNSSVQASLGTDRGGIVDMSKLASFIRDEIYEQVAEAEKQILKSRTNTADEIKARKRLYTSIFAIAYIVHLIYSQLVAVKSTQPIKLAFIDLKLDKSRALSQLVAHARNIIMSRKNTTIRELPGMTPEQIASLIIESYGEISARGKVLDVDEDDTDRGGATSDMTDISYDPIYRWITTINALDRIQRGGAAANNRSGNKQGRRGDNRRSFTLNIIPADAGIGDDILTPPAGVSKKTRAVAKKRQQKHDRGRHKVPLSELIMLYEGRRIPSFGPAWAIKDFYDLPAPTSKVRPNLKLAWRGCVAASFMAFDEQLSLPLDVSRIIHIDVDKSADKAAAVTFSPEYAKVHEQWTKICTVERRLLQHHGLAAALPFSWHIPEQSRSWARETYPPPLGRRFDEDGEDHKWNIYVVTGGITDGSTAGKPTAVAVRELTQAQIDKEAKSAVWTGVIVDKKCSVCNELFSTAAGLDQSRIIDSLNAKYRIDNFFRFYQNRCPEGQLHSTDEGGTKKAAVSTVDTKCSKCGFRQGQDQKSALAYYRRYRTIYDRDRAEMMVGLAEPTQPVPARIDNSWAKTFSRWSFKDEVVLDLATKLDINSRLLLSLGATEKVDYADVLSGVYIPPEEDSRESTRSFKIDSWISQLVIEWNMLRFYHRLIKPSAHLAALIDNSGLERQHISSLAVSLGDIRDNYESRYAWFRRNKKPREIVQFGIQSFCEMCLRIWDGLGGAVVESASAASTTHSSLSHLSPLPVDATKKLRQDFVRYMVGKILKAEEMITAPGYFSWSLLYGDRDSTTSEYDVNVDVNADDRDPEEIEDEKEDDYGDTNAPFSLDGFDMEEPSPEDEGGPVRAGESLGL